MATKTLMTFAEFETFLGANEWITNADFGKESFPDHPWFGIDTSAIIQKLGESADKILTALEPVAKDDVELRHIERNALELRHISHGNTKKIFFTGPAGVGKSSLFNALFNNPGLAKTSASGDACTSVVVRYTAATQQDTESFSVIIRFLKPEQIKEFIAAHAKVYHQRQFDTTGIDDFDNDVESSELKQFETARKFFSLVFGEDDFKKFFTPRTFAEESFQDLCLEKSLAKLSEVGVDQFTFTKQHVFRDTEELKANIEGYISDVPDKDCFWHLVDNVEIKCPFPMLRHNLEFIDSPGTGELNQMRIASTNRAKNSADLLCVIGDTGRIKTNELVIDSAIQAVTQHGPSKVAIIATKTDLVDDQDVMHEPGEPYKQAREVLSWIKVKQALAATQNTDEDTLQLLSSYEDYVLRELKETFVLDRAKKLEKDIPNTIKDLLPDRTLATDDVSELPVFSISSAQYMKWASKSRFKFDKAPDLSITATGVPGLRQHLLSLAADQNYDNYHGHLHEFFPGLLAKIGRVIDPNRSEGFAVIAEAFVKAIEVATEEFDGELTRHRDRLTQEALSLLTADRDHYLDSLDQEAENWQNIRYPTFRKMLREHGVLIAGASKVATMRRGYNINRNIARLLTPAFRGLARHLKSGLKELAEDLHKARKRINTMVINHIDSANSDLKSIEEAKKIWAPKGLALTSPITKLITKLTLMADSIGSLGTRETDCESFVARQLKSTYDIVYTARPQMVQKTFRKRKSAKDGPVIRTVFEKPIGVYSRELLHTLLKEGRPNTETEAMEGGVEEEEKEMDTDVITKIMAALHDLLKKKCHLYAGGFVEGVRAIMEEFLDEIQDLAPPDVEVTEASQAARDRLGEIVGELERNCEGLKELVPGRVQ